MADRGDHEAVVGRARELVREISGQQLARTLRESPAQRVLLLSLAPGREIRPHSPSSDLVLAVLRGGGELLVGSGVRQLRAGDFALVPRGQRRGLRCPEGQMVALAVVSPAPGPEDHEPPAGGGDWPEPESAPDPADVIRAEHAHLLDGVAELGRLGGEAAGLETSQLAARIDASVRFLEGELLPHAGAEERLIYPAVDELVRAHGGASRTMALDHRRIERLTRDLERIGSSPPLELDRAAAERALVALAAVVSLHFEKEEEDYLPRLHQLAPSERLGLLRALGVAPTPAVATGRREAAGRVSRPVGGD